jgi:NADH-quinone oxidoreductase subunit L
VIHAVHEEQDMRRMGGLAKKIPITYWTMLLASLAIAGIPPLAGFFSKDEILAESFKLHFEWVWAIGVIVAAMTAFYMFRLIGMTFWGQSRVDPHVEPQIHESPRWMTVPLILLAIPTVLAGLVLSWPGVPLGPLFGQVDAEGHPVPGLLATWLEPTFHEGLEILGHHEPTFEILGLDGFLILVSVAVAVAGILGASRIFGWEVGARIRQRFDLAERITNANGATRFLYRASLNKWWFDELNHVLFMVIGGRIAAALWWFDRNVVDGTVNGIGSLVRGTGGGLRRVQTGRVQNYALGIAIGLLVMAGSFLVIAAN